LSIAMLWSVPQKALRRLDTGKKLLYNSIDFFCPGQRTRRKTRMLKIITLIIILLATAGATRAKELDGFRDLAWGTGLDKLADRGFEKLPVPKGSVSLAGSYRLKNENLVLGGASCDSIAYNFLGGRLYSVTVDFSGTSNLRLIKEYCNKRFGASSGSMVKEMEYFVSFESPATGALIYYQFAKHSFFVRYGRLFLFSREIDRELR